MSVIPAGTEVPYTVTFLEMLQRPDFERPALPEGLRLERAIDPPVWYFLALYDAVGRDYEWQDRFREAKEDPAGLQAFVRDPDVVIWTVLAGAGRKGSSYWIGVKTGSVISPISALCRKRSVAALGKPSSRQRS